MRTLGWNVNGLRSLARAGILPWIVSSGYDVICLQETKVGPDLLTDDWFPGYDVFWDAGERPGHGGVATLVRNGLGARQVGRGVGDADLDREGRVLVVEAAGLRFVNVYAPHAHRKLLRRDAKACFMEAFDRRLVGSWRDGVPSVLVGDFNVAHTEIDLANARANRGNAGFLPEERAWVDRILAAGFVDAFRHLEPSGGHYTWWSMLPGVRERNVGWRLDYAFVEAGRGMGPVSCRHLRDRTGSDHCPVEVCLSAA